MDELEKLKQILKETTKKYRLYVILELYWHDGLEIYAVSKDKNVIYEQLLKYGLENVDIVRLIRENGILIYESSDDYGFINE